MKKRLLALTLALLMVLSLAACGGDPAQTKTEDDVSPAPEGSPEVSDDVSSDTKTMSYFSKYVDGGAYTMEMKTEYAGMTSTSLSAYDGDNIYSESETDGVKSIVIMKDGYQYILDPASKSCIKMSAATMQDMQSMFDDSAESYAAATSTGDEVIDGKSYFYEEFLVEGISAKYCFDGDDLKYIISVSEGETYSVEILSMKKGADKALFEVPSDYTIMEY